MTTCCLFSRCVEWVTPLGVGSWNIEMSPGEESYRREGLCHFSRLESERKERTQQIPSQRAGDESGGSGSLEQQESCESVFNPLVALGQVALGLACVCLCEGGCQSQNQGQGNKWWDPQQSGQGTGKASAYETRETERRSSLGCLTGFLIGMACRLMRGVCQICSLGYSNEWKRRI